MISDVEHLFICLLAICLSSLEKCLFKSFPIFKLDYFLLSLSCRSSLYILDINPLSNIWFTNIFLHCILPFQSADIVFWCKSIFNFNGVKLVYFSFVAYDLGVISKNHCQIHCHQTFLLFFFKEFYTFVVVAESCLTLWDTMDWSIQGLSVLYYLLEFAQVPVHWIDNAIQSSHPLSSTSPSAFSLSQHQDLFQWVGYLHQMGKVLELPEKAMAPHSSTLA